MKALFLVFFFCLFMSILGCDNSSQSNNEENNPESITSFVSSFVAIFGDWGSESFRSALETRNGDFIMAGTKSDSTGSHLVLDSKDAFIVKADACGDEIWTNYYGGDLDDGLTSIKETPDGGYVATGYSCSFSSGSFDSDVYLLRIDIDGNVVWFNTYDEGGSEVAYSIQITTDGDFILAGTCYDFNTHSRKMYLICTDSDGNKLWSHMYAIGTYEDVAFSVKETKDGGFILAGKAFLGASLGQEDIAILVTDRDGNELWSKTIGGPYDDKASCVFVTSDGGYAIVGSVQEDQYTLNGTDMVLIKTDQDGNELWRKTYEGEEGLMANDINKTSDGGFILVGGNPFAVGKYTIYLIKTDEYGNEQWRTTYKGDHGAHGYTVQETADTGFMIGGIQFKLDYSGCYDSDALLLKATDNGDVLR